MYRRAIAFMLGLTAVAVLLVTAQPANAVFMQGATGPHVHWAQAYNASDANAQTYRAFALYDRTDDFNQQTAVQWWVKRNNATRAQYNMGIPWAQYVGPTPGATCNVASGSVTTCTAHHNELGVGTKYAGMTEWLDQLAPNGAWAHFVWVRIWLDGARSYSLVQRESVACHELGHALGLGHSTAAGSCMNPVFESTSANPVTTYSTDDNNTINSLYAHPPAQ